MPRDQLGLQAVVFTAHEDYVRGLGLELLHTPHQLLPLLLPYPRLVGMKMNVDHPEQIALRQLQQRGAGRAGEQRGRLVQL